MDQGHLRSRHLIMISKKTTMTNSNGNSFQSMVAMIWKSASKVTSIHSCRLRYSVHRPHVWLKTVNVRNRKEKA